MKPKLVTVTGYRTNTLRQMISHYKKDVSEIHLVNYYSTNADNKKSFEEAREIAKEFGCVYHERKEKVFNWEAVTGFYNEIKSIYPNDWWIVSDDDELQLYWDDLGSIIEECEENGWEFVTGGFIDKIGESGEFPIVNGDTDLWKAFPISSFFRYPMSGACPNKVTLMKGRVELSAGQHYALIGGQTTWKWQGWNHPLIAPVEKYSVQVHHFKWDSTCLERIKRVADINQNYSYSDEYKIMYESIIKNKSKIDISDPNFMFEYGCTFFDDYEKWNILIKKIISI